jgi:hypothetical protein
MRVQGFKGPRVQATTRIWEIFDGVLGEEMKMRFSVIPAKAGIQFC